MVDVDQERSSKRYTVAIIKGSGLISETRALLSNWVPGENFDSFMQRMKGNDLLGTSTDRRFNDILKQVFEKRYLIPNDKPARILKSIQDHNLLPATFNELLFLFACRNDELLYDFTSQVYWPANSRGKVALDTNNAVDFITRQEEEGNIQEPWSAKSKVRVARGLMKTLSDVGFLQSIRHGRKNILPYSMTNQGAVILARLLHEEGFTDTALCEHPDWELFGLNRGDVVKRLDENSSQDIFIIQHAGSTISITWTIKSMKELIDVLAR